MSWKSLRLGEIAGMDRSIVAPDSVDAALRPYLGLEQIEAGTGRILSYAAESVEGKSTTFAFDKTHVLYGKLRPYLNKVAAPDRSGRCSTEIIPLLPRGVDREFLAFLLRTDGVIAAAMSGRTGSRMPRADMEALLDLEVSIPEAVDEQRRIAARLKAQLAEVETARQAAQAQVQDAVLLRQRILDTAFGELADVPVEALRDAAEIVAGITLGRKTKETELTEVPYLRVANVKDGRLDLLEVKKVAASRREIEKWTLRDGDLLLTEGGDLDKLGRGACWREQLPLCIHQNHIFRVRFALDRYDPDFVSMQVGSSYGKAYFFAHAKKTTGIASINQGVLGSFPLLSPSLADQHRLVARLQAQLAEAAAIHAAAAAQLAEIERLPQRLLAQAFA